MFVCQKQDGEAGKVIIYELICNSKLVTPCKRIKIFRNSIPRMPLINSQLGIFLRTIKLFSLKLKTSNCHFKASVTTDRSKGQKSHHPKRPTVWISPFFLNHLGGARARKVRQRHEEAVTDLKLKCHDSPLRVQLSLD